MGSSARIPMGNADVDSEEMIDRMEALRDAIRILPSPGQVFDDDVSDTPLWLVVAEKVADWSINQPSLNGPGYLYQFVVTTGGPTSTNDLSRIRIRVLHQLIAQISATHIRWNRNGGAFQLDAR